MVIDFNDHAVSDPVVFPASRRVPRQVHGDTS